MSASAEKDEAGSHAAVHTHRKGAAELLFGEPASLLQSQAGASRASIHGGHGSVASTSSKQAKGTRKHRSRQASSTQASTRTDAAAVLADPTGSSAVDEDPVLTREWVQLQATHRRRRMKACLAAGGHQQACSRAAEAHSQARRLAVPSGSEASTRRCMAKRSIAASLLSDAVETPAFETLRTQQ